MIEFTIHIMYILLLFIGFPSGLMVIKQLARNIGCGLLEPSPCRSSLDTTYIYICIHACT